MIRNLMHDRVTHVKKDGTVMKENIRASVQTNRIFMDDETLQLQPEDSLLRILPSGLVEEYIVEDPGFFAGGSMLPSHFQTKVRRSDAPVATATSIIQNITHNFTISGNNSRINFNSTDNSQNTVSGSDTSAVLHELRRLLEASQIPSEQAQACQTAIDRMASAETKESRRDAYLAFMSSAADHMTVFAPILARLTSTFLGS
ncbi:hypothetical protein [Martelella sp. AD-3]|uniref:hypothetical protein n=1 Tax=Martelella sp. AD-3 TaxID=686597 RepID=UPI0004643EFB|nr:hypothetical protein [Martelella sp. AD-3]AMM84118.1 hypothetical protein AZF01_06910 [Martelella sp. AD-3]